MRWSIFGVTKILHNNNCEFDKRNEVSDAASFGPGGIVADSSIVNDPLSMDMIFDIMVPFVGSQVACPICLEREIHQGNFFLSLADLGRHLHQHHATARIQWRCRDCGKGFPELHGARCHLPHCSDSSQRPEGPYKCEACPMSFWTQRGLPIHERHAHPVVRNVTRRGADPQIKNGRLKRWLSWGNSVRSIRITDTRIK